MGAKDDTEKVLRQIHVLFSKAQPYEESKIDVVVNKNEMMDLLKQLNDAMYGMMEEYELTWAKRDKAEREQRKRGDEIVLDAQRKAEDVYAASIMYTDRSLEEIRRLVEESREEVKELHRKLEMSIDDELCRMKTNQTELHSQLSDMIDSQKYLRLIEEENRRAAREAAKGKKAHEGGEYTPMPYAEAAAPEIRVDPAYFEKRAQMLSEESGLELTPAAMGSGYGSDLDALNEELTPLDDPRIERARESFAPEETEKDEADANSAVSRVLQIFHRSKDS